MMEWRIYYSDGSTFDSSMGSPVDAPKFCVQAITEAHLKNGSPTTYVWRYWDYYFYRTDFKRWCGVGGHDGLVLYMANHIEDISALMVGEMLVEQEFDEIVNKALNDPDFPKRVPRANNTQEVPDKYIKAGVEIS